MLKRKITEELIKRKENQLLKKKALLIKGLRQIGKTFIIRDFARKHYKYEVYIDFKRNSELKTIFDGDFSVDRILMDLSAKIVGLKFVPHETLIIFDEIQECANARTALKYFVDDGRYDVIASGSLLGIRGYNKKKSRGVPTGSEHIIYMHPLDFEEFLWAKGVSEEVIYYLKECFESRKPISKVTHESLLRYFKEYICVGGLPEAVNIFLKTGNLNLVYQEQRDILEEYKDDFGKHLNEEENEEVDEKLLVKILEVFNSIPSQLTKENKKFQYSWIKKSARASEYIKAIQRLKEFGIISQCYNLSNLQKPLEGNKIDNIFKIYMRDSGLFIAMLDKGTAGEIISGNLGIYKGAIFENIVADSFSKMDRNLYYFEKDSGLEIDFVTTYKNEVTLIEVKAKTGNAKASKTILNNYSTYNVKKCIKLGEYNIGESDNILTIPYYLAFLLKE